MVSFPPVGKYTNFFQFLKQAIVVLSRTTYYQIFLLSNISKVFECLVFKITSHINTSISALQFGFSKNSSTLQQMLLFMDSIGNMHPSQTDVIYLNISKGFDMYLIVSC